MRFSTLSSLVLLPLLSVVHADGASILAAMSSISAATVKLNNTLAPWEGNPLTLISIVIDSAELLSAINSATTVAENSANLTAVETVSIAQSTLALASTVNSTLDVIIAKKPVFQKELLQPVILVNLLAEKSATDNFGNAVIAKVPAALQAAAETVIAPFDTYFSNAIDDYESL